VETRTESGLAVISRIGRPQRALGSAVSPLPPVPPVQPWAGWPQAAGWQTPMWNGTVSPLAGYVSTVYTCVDLNSRQLASFPIYRMRGTQHLPDVAWMTNPCPELYTDWIPFAKQLMNTLQLRGESFVYALARYSDGTVAQMCVIDPDAVDIDVLGSSIDYRIGGMPVDRVDVLHIPYQTWPGELRGISPLQWVGRNLYSADALERYGAQLAAEGGVPWGVLTTPANLTAAQVDENRQRWVESAARRGAAPVMLSGGLQLETLTLSPTDMALLDLRVFDEQRICAAFGVPPYLVGLPQAEGLTYANATSLFDYHWRATLRPKAQTVASALSAWALPSGQRIEFNRDEYVRPDFGERVAAYAVLHGIEDETGHGMTIDEIRQAERLTPHDAAPSAAAALTGPVSAAVEGT
jgi:HK97 family phage portal protein